MREDPGLLDRGAHLALEHGCHPQAGLVEAPVVPTHGKERVRHPLRLRLCECQLGKLDPLMLAR